MMSNNILALQEPLTPSADGDSLAAEPGDRTISAVNADKQNAIFQSSLFNAFADLVELLSPALVIQATELQGGILERALDRNRPVPRDEAMSIISFCRFIRAIRQSPGSLPLFAPPIPSVQLAFYRKTVSRLIQAGELPESTLREFDYIFGTPADAAVNSRSAEVSTPAGNN